MDILEKKIYHGRELLPYKKIKKSIYNKVKIWFNYKWIKKATFWHKRKGENAWN